MMNIRLTLLCGVGFLFLSGLEIRAQEELTFDRYLHKVGKQNLEFMATSMNVKIADAEVVAAKVLPDPSLDFEAARDNFSLGLSYTLELGKRHARVQMAKSERDMEKLALEGNFQDLRAKSAELFLDAILQRELLKVKKESYSYMSELSTSDSLRFVKGEITENDARQTRLETVSLLNDVYEQEAAYHSALVELNQFMGVDSDTLFCPVGNWENLERDFQLSQLLDVGRIGRPEILVASKNMEVLQKNYKLVRAERRPDIDLSLSYERDWNHFLPQARLATLGVSIPLNFSNINKGAIKSAKLQREQAGIGYKNVELQVSSEIRQSWFGFEAERKKVAQYRQGIMDESRKVLDGMVYKYKRGEATVLDVLVSQRTYNEVCQDYLETMKGYVSSLVTLERSCGFWDIHF